MNKRKLFSVTTLILRIAISMGLIGVPSSGWGQESTFILSNNAVSQETQSDESFIVSDIDSISTSDFNNSVHTTNINPLVPQACSPNPICKDEVNGVVLIRVNVADTRIAVKPGTYNGAKNWVKSIVQNQGAVVGINADYFGSCSTNCWQGVMWRDGQYFAPNSVYRQTWRGRRTLRISDSKSLSIDFGNDSPSSTWQNAVSGGPQFIRNRGFWWDDPQYYCGNGTALPCTPNSERKVIVNGEHFDANPIWTQWHTADFASRMSAVGFDGSTLVLAASNGSISNRSMASLLIQQGVKDALRLDGGGSTQLYSRYPGTEINIGSSDNRGVANALLIFFDNTVVNRPPNTPALLEPVDNNVSQNGRAPTLCWNNNGDPDGDQVQFYAEVFDSERGANSGWISSTCWRPGNLDGNYFNYQWRVKARDDRNAESGWSGSRRFTIEPENRPPTIAFNTANGNSSGEINSRDQTWTFTGIASDPEGRLNRVEFKCEGDSCNTKQNIGTNGNWTFQRSGLTGRNRVWFTACDDRQCVDSRVVTLRIDLAPPATTADANGQSNPSGWFRGPVEVKLRAQDGATGSAAVGVREIRYRIDNGNWQSSSSDSKSLTINTDGAHTVEYYAVDHLDNQESPAKHIAFQIDATPPSAPGAATETHGVGNDQWQKSVGSPEFTWGPASDSTSGLQHYELYFGPDANSDQIQSFVAANADRRWTPLPNGVRTGVYYLRARARDIAGNYSAWSTLFTFRYDVTPPGNPTAATHAANLPSGSWQRTSATADFTWTPPSDEGSGVKGYYVYWGDQPEGKDESPGAFRTSAAYVATGPLCVAGQSCTGYLRVRSVDYVDNFAGDWSTLYTLRYDGAAPTLDFTINGGVTQTAQTLVSLNLNATDQGSGVRDARSFAGNGWSPWEAYQTERVETIPAIGRQSWPVYVQVRDAVGWESTVISKSVYFEVNRPQPKSANFWLFTGMFNGGNGSHTSANYQGRSSVGQSVDAAPITSPNYILRGGYQAASQALPLQVPDHDEFTLINGIFASGIVNGTMQSAQYRLASSIGQMGLPTNQTTISSAGYQLQPGFLAAVPAQQTTPIPPPTPTPGPTPTPEPLPGCEFATLSINNGALFTNNPNVTLNLCGPQAVEMKVSNDGSFANAPWEPYRTSKGWTLATLGQNVIARLVQARFKDSAGLTHHYAVDDIIYDPTAPSGALAVNDPVPAALLAQGLATNVVQAASSLSTAAMESFTIGDMTYVSRLGNRLFPRPVPLLAPRNEGGLDVYLIAQDDNSGLAQMQLSENADGDGATWQDYDGLVQWTPSGGDGEKQLYARFLDSAGNASSVYSATVVIDSQPPLGGVNIIQEIIGTNTVSLQLYLAAEDNLSSIPAIRLSHDPTFADAPWQPFIAEVNWPIQVNANENEKTIYVQFRDAAGNVSQTYSDTVLIDRQPPVMYVEVATGDSLTRQVNLYAYDELSALTTMRLSNDPLLLDAVVTLPYSDTVAWTFDERRVVWVQVDDGAGNRSDPYPAYAAMPGDTPDPEPVDQRVYLPLINR